MVLLDHGLYEYVQPKDRVALCNLYKAIILRDEEGMQKYSNEMGVEGRNCVQCRFLFSDMQNFLNVKNHHKIPVSTRWRTLQSITANDSMNKYYNERKTVQGCL